jgi:hypothetical protein
MSYAEFSYPLVQAWDWWHLFQKGVQIQVGGGDQFGNILAGAEAVKQLAKDSHEYQSALRQTTIIDKKYDIDVTSDPLGITVPLLTTASGEKFGKSAGNAVWLEPKMTPIFDLYQVSTFLFLQKGLCGLTRAAVFPTFCRRRCRKISQVIHLSVSAGDCGNRRSTRERSVSAYRAA